MSDYFLDNWKQYLSSEDYNYLVTFIENIKNGIVNEKMIILYGAGRTGKTTLKNNITSYLGNDVCGNYIMSGSIIYEENIKKLIVLDEIYNKSIHNQAIINLIKYKQSIISVINNIEKVNKKLLEYSYVIYMNHKF
jgi:DNA helicase TIP49 (TBP-interacting protein)